MIVDQVYAQCACSGKAKKVSMPYFAGDTVYWTETQYDGLGRVKKVIPPDGSPSSNNTEYKYYWEEDDENDDYPKTRSLVGVFDATGKGRVYVNSSSGELLEVREDPSYSDLSSSVVTEYETYVLENDYLNPGDGNRYSKKVIQEITQGDQEREFRYDSLGRMFEETHPENGSVDYTFDDAGRVLTRTDARNIVTTTSYDTINRPTQISYSDSTPTVTYTYDTGTYGIGRPYSVANANATSTYTYDLMGRTTQHQKNIGGTNFTAAYSYNLASQQTSMTLPNGTVISRSHNSIGQLSAITSSWVDANHPATLANNFVYDASGAMTSVDYGNGTKSTRSFNTGGQLKTLQHGTTGTPGALLDLEYNYDESAANNGRIKDIYNYNDRTKDLNFSYDDFYRLDTAQTAGSHWGLSWSYDRYGNRLSQSVTKGTAPTQSLTVSTTTNRVSGWSYDAAGNTLNDGLHTYTYDANNQVTQLDGGTAVYKYDASGSRVQKITASETISYVMGGEYSSVTGWKKLYVYLGSEKLAEYSSSTTYFYHSDHLGTPKTQTNVAGAVVETWDNYPFGEQWTQSGGAGNEHRFTGHLRDSESGNEYAGARYYSSNRGRWLSVDPVLGSTSNPQRLNRYGYVLNDPVNLADPDGLDEGRPILVRNPTPRGPGWRPNPGDVAQEFASDAARGSYGLPMSIGGNNQHDTRDGFSDSRFSTPTIRGWGPTEVHNWGISPDCITAIYSFLDAVQQFEPYSAIAIDIVSGIQTLSGLYNDGELEGDTVVPTVLGAAYGIGFSIGQGFLMLNPAMNVAARGVGIMGVFAEMTWLNSTADGLGFAGENTLTGSEVVSQTNAGAFIGAAAAYAANKFLARKFADQIIEACGTVDNEN